MLDVYEFIFDYLKKFGKTSLQDVERDSEGKAILDNINIVYQIGNGTRLFDNRIRTEYELIIDVWGKDLIEIERVLKDIQKIDGELVHLCDHVVVVRKSDFFRINLSNFDKNINRVRNQYTLTVYEK